MKKFSIALVVLATALAISAAAKADTIYTFSFGYTGYNSTGHTGNDVSGSLSGTFNAGAFDLTGGTLTVSFGLGAAGSTESTPVTYDLYTGNANPYSGATHDGLTYDNVVDETSPYLDSKGLLFTEVGHPSVGVEIFYVGGGPSDPVWEFEESNGHYNVGSFVTFPPSVGAVVTPEPSSLLLLGSGLLGLAFVAFRRSKPAVQPGLSLGAL